MGGEFGHVIIDEAGPPCRCGNRGCWERYASNSATIRYFTESAGPSEPRDQPPPSFDDILRRADGGDARALDALARMGRFLGIGIAALATGLAPEVIVIVGDVTAAWDRVGAFVMDEVGAAACRTRPHGSCPPTGRHSPGCGAPSRSSSSSILAHPWWPRLAARTAEVPGVPFR